MTERSFRKRWMGYDPAQVEQSCLENDDRLRSVSIQLKDAEARIAALSSQLISAERRANDSLVEAQSVQERFQEQAASIVASASYTHLGERVSQILALAEAEAAEVRADADLYAEEVRIVAEEDGTRLIDEARASAAEQVEAAEREAAEMRAEGEAFLKKQKQAGTQEAAASAKRKKELEATLERKRGEAEKQAAALLVDAEERAAVIIAEAQAAADRATSDAERQVNAATAQRDGINAQLANVRRTLATLSGTTPAEVVDAVNGATAEADHQDEPVAEDPSAITDSDVDGENGEEDAGDAQPKAKQQKSGLKLVSTATLTPKRDEPALT